MSKYEVTFNRNVKYGEDTYRAGEKASVSEEDIEALAEVIVEQPKVTAKPKAEPKAKK